jgi:hypothetical protein
MDRASQARYDAAHPNRMYMLDVRTRAARADDDHHALTAVTSLARVFDGWNGYLRLGPLNIMQMVREVGQVCHIIEPLFLPSLVRHYAIFFICAIVNNRIIRMTSNTRHYPVESQVWPCTH